MGFVKGFIIIGLLVLGISQADAVNVLTYHNDLARTGQNTNEISLTPANVNTNSFGKLFSYPVDGYVYAQPLVMTGVNVTGFGVRTVVFVATEHNSVYAFDAESNSGPTTGLFWKVSFIDPSQGMTTVPSDDPQINCGDLVPEIGITSTPVIDPVSGTLYVVAKTREITGGVTNFVYRLHALSIADGSEKFGGPVEIQASVPGTGLGTDGFGQVPFDPIRELNRMGLLLNNGLVYFGFSSHCGDGGHGWLFTYNAQTLSLSNAFLSTPNGQQGGIWEGGCAPASDGNGNVYISTGNGNFDGPFSNNYGDSLLKFSKGLQLLDYFTPMDQADLFSEDRDLGAGGVVLLPDDVGSALHPHLMLCAGKKGNVYLVDRDNLGQYDSGANHVVQELGDFAIGSSFGPPAYFNKTLYYFGANDQYKAFTISNAFIDPTPSSLGPVSYKFPGAGPSITANGTNNGIVWTIETRGYATNGPALLHAYNAADLSQEFYNSSQLGVTDQPGAAVKFAVPTVANGKVYVGTQSALTVFGLKTSFDSVGDGIPDWWRAQYFGTGSSTNKFSCSTCDADGTGQVNLFKYVAGLDPTNRAAVFRLDVQNVAGHADQKTLRFYPIADGRTYQVISSTNLVGGVTGNLTSSSGPSTNGTQVSVTDLNATGKAKFYRVRISLP